MTVIRFRKRPHINISASANIDRKRYEGKSKP
jgi:hypothetical protein